MSITSHHITQFSLATYKTSKWKTSLALVCSLAPVDLKKTNKKYNITRVIVYSWYNEFFPDGRTMETFSEKKYYYNRSCRSLTPTSWFLFIHLALISSSSTDSQRANTIKCSILISSFLPCLARREFLFVLFGFALHFFVPAVDINSRKKSGEDGRIPEERGENGIQQEKAIRRCNKYTNVCLKMTLNIPNKKRNPDPMKMKLPCQEILQVVLTDAVTEKLLSDPI